MLRLGTLRPPRQVRGLLEPLAVLDRLRGADHRERLVGREHAVPAGQRVALQPAVAVVLAESTSITRPSREMATSSVGDTLREARGRTPRRRRPAGCCWSRRDRTAGTGPGCAGRCRASARRACESTRRARCPAAAPPARSRGSPGRSRSRVSKPPFACGERAHPEVTVGIGRAGPARSVGRSSSNSSSGPVGPHPLLEHAAGARGCSRTPDSGTWCARQVPCDLDAVDDVGAGPALRGAQDDQRPAWTGRRPSRRRGRRPGSPDRRPGPGQGAAKRWCIPGRSSPVDLDDVVPVALEQRAHLGRVLAGQHGRAGDLARR